MSPNVSPSRRDRQRPDLDEPVGRAGEEQRVDDKDRGQQDGRDAHGPDERAEQAGRPAQEEQRDGEDRQDEWRQEERAERTSASPRSFVSGCRRWSQLEPAMK